MAAALLHEPVMNEATLVCGVASAARAGDPAYRTLSLRAAMVRAALPIGGIDEGLTAVIARMLALRYTRTRAD